MMFEIKKYERKYEDELMELIKAEGEDWAVYYKEPNASKYRKSFEQSITYIALAVGKVCGYSRSLKDTFFMRTDIRYQKWTKVNRKSLTETLNIETYLNESCYLEEIDDDIGYRKNRIWFYGDIL